MRKRDIELTSDDLERPGDDPREFVALRHNLRQLQREVTELQQREAAERARREQEVRAVRNQVSRSYEESASWSLTRSLRSGASFIRSVRGRLQHR
jgi:hypothetical protein